VVLKTQPTRPEKSKEPSYKSEVGEINDVGREGEDWGTFVMSGFHGKKEREWRASTKKTSKEETLSLDKTKKPICLPRKGI